MMEEGSPVYQEYGEYEEYMEQEYAEPDVYVDRYYPGMEIDEDDMELGGGGLAPFSVSEILEHCIEPTLTDGLKHMGKIIAWCFIFRMATQTTKVVPWLGHAASVVSGTVLASHFFGGGVFYILGLVMLGYIMLAVSNKVRGLASAALVLGYNIVCETWVAEPMIWHMVRGAIMIVAMKIISLGFDMDAATLKSEKEEYQSDKGDENVNSENGMDKKKNVKTPNIKNRGKKNGRKLSEEHLPEAKEDVITEEPDLTKMPGWFEFAGYCLCPGTVILGPWVSYKEYSNIFKEPKWNITWLVKILFTVMFAFMFLTISTCWNPWLIPDSGWKWWLAYRDAMSFRASHYFVSFMSEASAIAAGFGGHVLGTQILWHYTVTQPHNIEVPRSLVEVVVSWNLPMHRWLKQYVFKQTRSRLGPGPAVVMTYIASTLLHGLSGQLAAVLLSLGFYTWVEHSIREKLSNIMDASIGARREADCRRKHREGSAWVILVNLLFGLLSMFHLAYLGVMFDQSSPDQVTGYSWSHTMAKWKMLDFTSHWVVGVTAIFNWLL